MRGEQLQAVLFGLFLLLAAWGPWAILAVLVYREIGSWPA